MKHKKFELLKIFFTKQHDSKDGHKKKIRDAAGKPLIKFNIEKKPHYYLRNKNYVSAQSGEQREDTIAVCANVSFSISTGSVKYDVLGRMSRQNAVKDLNRQGHFFDGFISTYDEHDFLNTNFENNNLFKG